MSDRIFQRFISTKKSWKISGRSRRRRMRWYSMKSWPIFTHTCALGFPFGIPTIATRHPTSSPPLQRGARRKHTAWTTGCVERLPKRSQITMECRQTSVRRARHTVTYRTKQRPVQRLRKEITRREGERETASGPPRASFRLLKPRSYSTRSRRTLANVCELFEMLMG